MSPLPELTIISVYHNWISKRLLETNAALVRRLNPDVRYTWLAANNTPRDFPHALKGDFFVVRNDEKYLGLGSHHHASGINLCLPHVTTRFFASLDSDFMIVRPQWMKEALDHMQNNKLAFFGVTYFPKDMPKYRYFPCVVFMIIDLKRVPLATIDFMPRYNMDAFGHAELAYKKQPREERNREEKIIHALPRGLRDFLNRLRRTFGFGYRRKFIGAARDTSYAIYERYHNTPLKRDNVTPVFDYAHDPQIAELVFVRINRIIERFLPDSLRYIPGKLGAYTSAGFREMGYFDCRALGWEEYVWKGKPFATHIHGLKTAKRGRTDEEEVKNVQRAIDELVNAHVRST